jgi:hypothetical protein
LVCLHIRNFACSRYRHALSAAQGRDARLSRAVFYAYLVPLVCIPVLLPLAGLSLFDALERPRLRASGFDRLSHRWAKYVPPVGRAARLGLRPDKIFVKVRF